MTNQKSLPGRVIVTHGRSLQALAAARSLGARGLEVIGCDHTPLMMLSFSRHVRETFLHPDPREDEAAYIDALVEQVRAFAPDDGRPYVLMPIHRDTRILARHRDRFAPHIHLAVPATAAIDAVHPKQNLSVTAGRLGVEAPRTELVACEGELAAAAEKIGFPLFLKAPAWTGGRGVVKAADFDTLTAQYRAMAPQLDPADEGLMLLQELVPGADYCLTLIARDGDIAASMAYRNLQTFPVEGGFGVLRETVEAGRLPDIAQDLMGPIGWNGVAEIDFRWDGDPATTPKLIEVNPRFWGGLFHSVESGIDYPWLLYNLAAFGGVPEPGPVAIGTRTKVPALWALAAIAEVAEHEDSYGDLSRAWEEVDQALFTEGDIGRGLGALVAGLGEALLPEQPIEALGKRLGLGDRAKSEVLSADDPLACLGVLYVLGSLLRSGRLPAELIRDKQA